MWIVVKANEHSRISKEARSSWDSVVDGAYHQYPATAGRLQSYIRIGHHASNCSCMNSVMLLVFIFTNKLQC